MILSLYLTLDCNHRCTYCYAAPHRKADMSLATAERAVRLTADHCRALGDPILGIRFFGGEPLLRWDLIPPVVELALRPEVSNGLDVALGIATNGTLLTPERCDFFLQHDFGVGISMDGGPEIHDRNRVFVHGGGTWQHVRRKLQLALDRGLRVSLALVADPSTISELPRSLQDIHEETGCSFYTISFNIHAEWTARDLDHLEHAYRELGRYYIRCFKAGQPIQVDFLNNKVNVLLRGGFLRESICAIGTSDLAVTPEGRIHPCLRLAAMDPEGATAIGDVAEGLDHQRVSALRETCDRRFSPEALPERCAACPHPASCLNWCAATNLAMTGNPALVGEVMCRHEQANVAAAQDVLDHIDLSVYQRLYADYFRTPDHRLGQPSVPHGVTPLQEVTPSPS